jgi:putative flippase GtrA
MDHPRPRRFSAATQRRYRPLKALLLQQKKFLLYCAIGTGGVTLDFGIFSLLVHSGRLEYQAANAMGYAGGTLLSFILNARFNFRVADKLTLRLASFFGVAFLGWLVSFGLLYLLIGLVGFNKYVSKLAVLAVVVLLQYNLNRRLSFRKST